MAQAKKTKRNTTTRSASKKAPAQKAKGMAAAKDEAVITLNDTVSAVETATSDTKAAAEEATGSSSKSPAEEKTTRRTSGKTATKSTEKKHPSSAPSKATKAKDTAKTSADKAAAKEITASTTAKTEKAPAKKSASERTEKKASTKAPAKKASAAKASTATQETYFEIAGEQILMEDINERIRQSWLAEGHFPSRLRTIKTYLNLEERRAYYVINGKAENKYVEF